MKYWSVEKRCAGARGANILADGCAAAVGIMRIFWRSAPHQFIFLCAARLCRRALQLLEPDLLKSRRQVKRVHFTSHRICRRQWILIFPPLCLHIADKTTHLEVQLLLLKLQTQKEIDSFLLAHCLLVKSFH